MLQLLAICCDILRFRCQAKEVLTAVLNIQGSAKRWALVCVIPASWVPLAAEREFTQPTLGLSVDPNFYPIPVFPHHSLNSL